MPDISALVCAAVERRTHLHARADQTAYRLFHGYGEGRPGLTIDRYGDVVLIAHKAEAADELPAVLAGLDAATWTCPATVIAKAQRSFNWNATALSVTALRGDLPTQPVEVLDNGLRLAATPHAPEANGLFLDTRLVRAWLLENSRDRRVLNLFAYTGSLGVAAGVGGARDVVHVDKNKGPFALARQSNVLNGLAVDNRSFMAGDVYKHLPRAARAGSQFEGIILDPPPRAQDFAKLTSLTTRLLAPGGWLLCFFHRFDRTREDFEAEVQANAECALDVLWRGTSGEDFPENEVERKLRVTAFVRPDA